MTKPVCVPCGRFYRPHHNGYPFVEAMPKGTNESADDIPRGREGAAHWQPYKLWLGDMWRCEGCGHELVIGAAMQAISEHYMPTFPSVCEEVTKQYGRGRPLLTVNDC